MNHKRRDENLDLLRAIAIVVVVIYHFAILWPIENEVVRRCTSLGNYGVDLFFILSGFLIGGLYFSERKANGNVDGLRFWFRRALRTMPPYFAILPVAWLAVYIARREPFAWQYLIFLQNYMKEMPFYLASWSLCVEEHFYVLLVPLLGICFRLKISVAAVLLVLIPLPALLRWFDPNSLPYMPFGYAEAATHLRISGILMGVLSAYLLSYHEDLWNRLKRIARWISLPLVAIFFSIPFWTAKGAHYLAPELAALTSACVLCAIQGNVPSRLARSRVVFWVANTSYSVYLTHGLAFHVGILVGKKLPFLPSLAVLFVWIVLAMVSGFVFWFFVERNAIRIRDYLVPKTKHPQNPAR